MSSDEIGRLVSEIAGTRHMSSSDYGRFRARLISQSDQLGENMISLLGPVWSTWPRLAEDAVEHVFLESESPRCFGILLRRLRTAKARDAGTVHSVLRTFYEYSRTHTDATAAIAIRAIFAISQRASRHYKPTTMAGDDAVRNARFYMRKLSEENGVFLQSSLARIWPRIRWWLATWF